MKKVIITGSIIATLVLAGCSAGPQGPDEKGYLNDFEDLLVDGVVMDDLSEGFLQWGYDHCEARQGGMTRAQLVDGYDYLFTETGIFHENAEIGFMEAAETRLCEEVY